MKEHPKEQRFEKGQRVRHIFGSDSMHVLSVEMGSHGDWRYRLDDGSQAVEWELTWA